MHIAPDQPVEWNPDGIFGQRDIEIGSLHDEFLQFPAPNVAKQFDDGQFAGAAISCVADYIGDGWTTFRNIGVHLDEHMDEVEIRAVAACHASRGKDGAWNLRIVWRFGYADDMTSLVDHCTIIDIESGVRQFMMEMNENEKNSVTA